MRIRRISHSFIVLFVAITLILPPGILEASGISALPEPSFNDTSIRLPESLGTVEWIPASGSAKTIFFIQDAHNSLEAQKHIAASIRFLVHHRGVKTVFEEGYEGPVPTARFFGAMPDARARRKVADFLLDRLRLGGAEFAHINRTRDFKLIGADNLSKYRHNLEAFREAAANSGAVEEDLNLLLARLEPLAQKRFPKPLRQWLRWRDRYESGKTKLPDYLRRSVETASSSEDAWQALAPQISSIRLLLDAQASAGRLESLDARRLFDEMKILEDGIARQFLTDPDDLELSGYREALHLLKRLNRLEVSPSEYEASRKVMASLETRRMAAFMARLSGTSLALSREWETRIKTAVNFYEAALQRDSAIENTLAAFLDNPGEKEAVLVFGGFHKAGILAILKRLGIACALVTPKISAPDPVHEGYYRQLMTDGTYDYESAFLSSRSAVPGATRPPSSFIAPFGELTARRLYQAAVQNPEISFALLDRVPPARAEVRPSTVVGRLRNFLKWQVFGNLETSLRDAVILLTDTDPLIQEEGLRAIEVLRTYDPMLNEAADDLSRELMVRVHRSERAPQTAIQQADDIDRRLRASVSVLNDAFDLYRSEMREDLFLPEEIERLRKRVQYLSELYPKLGSESKKTLLYPSFLAAFLLLKPAYFRIQNEHRQEPDPVPLFKEIQSLAPEIWSKLGLTVSEQEIYDVTFSISEIFNHMQFLADHRALEFPEDEADLKQIGDLYDQQRFQEFDEVSAQFIRKIFQRAEGHEQVTHVLQGVLLGYPEEDIAALIEDKPRIMIRGSFEDIGLLAAGRNPDEVSVDSRRYLERLDAALHYAYARLLDQPGFSEAAHALGLPPDAGHHSELRSTPKPFSLAHVDLNGFETDEMLEVYQEIRESMMTTGYEAPPEFDDDPTFLSETERLQEWSFAVRAKDDRIAGFVLNDPEPSAGGGYLEVELLGVDPGHQGEGYGHRLLAASEVLARRLGKKALWLEVNRENQDAIRLYQSYGFRRRSAEGNADYMVMHKKIRLLKNPQRPGDLPGREAPAAFPAPEFFRRPARPSVIRKMRTELRSDERSDPVSRRWIQPLLRQARVRSENFVSTQAGLYVPAPDHFWGEVLAAFPAADAEPFKVFSAGSGQGIFEVFLAHARPKARIAGVEHEASLLVESLRLKTAAQAAGRIAEGQVEFKQGDFNDPSFAASIAEADYVYYYEGGTKHPETLIHTLMQQMKPGARVVVLGSQLRESDFFTGLEKTGVFIVESDGRPVRVLRRAELRTAGLEEMIATLKMQDLEALSAQGLKTLFMPLLAAVEGQPLISDKGTFFLLALILAAEPVLSSWTVLRILTAKQRKIMKIEGLLEEAARGPQPKRLRSRASLLKILLESLGDKKNPRVQSVADEILKVLVKRVEGLEWFVHDVVRKEIILPGEQPRDAGLAFHPHLFEGRENLRKLMPSDYYEHLYKIGEQQDLPQFVPASRAELRAGDLERLDDSFPEAVAAVRRKALEVPAAGIYPELGRVIDLRDLLPMLPSDLERTVLHRMIYEIDQSAFEFEEDWDFAPLKLKPDGMKLLFVEESGEISGHVSLSLDEALPHLENLATLKKMDQKAGRGQLLMNHAIRKLREKRFSRMQLYPTEMAMPFYNEYFSKRNIWFGQPDPVGDPFRFLADFADVSDENLMKVAVGRSLIPNSLPRLLRSEMRLTLSKVREFLDRRPHAVWYASYDKQGQETVEYVNPAFAKVYGTTVQDILDKKTYRSINGPEAPVDKFKADDAKALKQGIFMGREGNPRVTVVKIRFQGGGSWNVCSDDFPTAGFHEISRA